jgi:ech hydrogenase subunit B
MSIDNDDRGGVDLMNIQSIITVVVAIIVAPLLGGLITGIDRWFSARLQGRIGPPIFQPFYDVLKLFSKRGSSCSKFQIIAVWILLVSSVLSLCLLALQQDIVAVFYVLGLGSVAFIMSAFSIRSPYGQLGAQREVMQLLIFEPLLLFFVIGLYLATGSFMVSDIHKSSAPLLYSMPMFFITMVMVILIKMRKSPFDISSSAHHAHQEVVQGPLTEMSGPTLACVELAHWYELVLLLAFVALLWATSPIGAILIALAAIICSTLVDNLTARMTWMWMLTVGWTFGMGMALVNLAALYFLSGGPK